MVVRLVVTGQVYRVVYICLVSAKRTLDTPDGREIAHRGIARFATPRSHLLVQVEGEGGTHERKSRREHEMSGKSLSAQVRDDRH